MSMAPCFRQTRLLCRGCRQSVLVQYMNHASSLHDFARYFVAKITGGEAVIVRRENLPDNQTEMRRTWS